MVRQVRPAAVAGLFYPLDAAALQAAVQQFLDAVPAASAPPPKALVVPHAGYPYSGPVAASAYALLRGVAGQIDTVVLLGPAHRVWVEGLALPGARAFRTPLGEVAVDRAAARRLQTLPQVSVDPEAHRLEHSLEVQLPFLQSVLGRFELLPLLVGQADADAVAEVLDRLWGGEETLIVISTDLSHYHDPVTARAMDTRTAHALEQGRLECIDAQHACGCRALAGLMRAAARHGLHVRTLDLRNSGDTAGPRDQVVGYGAFALQ